MRAMRNSPLTLCAIIFGVMHASFGCRPDDPPVADAVKNSLAQQTAHAPAAEGGREYYERVDREVKNAIGYLSSMSGTALVPSSVCAVVKGDTVVFKRAFRTSTTRLFDAASHTKFFTALSVFKLQDDGLLNIDDKISDYLPVKIERASLGSAPVTIRHLLAHISGIHPYAGYETVNTDPPLSITKQYFKTGTTFHYSNEGYNILGALVAKVSGENLGRYVTRNFIEPMEMKYATAPDTMRGASGVKWCLEDMIQFLKLYLGKGEYKGRRLVGKQWFTEIYKINRPGIPLAKNRSYRGLCWRVWTIDDRPYSANHASLWAASGGWMQMFPTLNVGYVFMTDTPYFGEHYDPFMRFYSVMQYYLNRVAGALSSADLDPSTFRITRTTRDLLEPYAGQYVNPVRGGRVDIVIEGSTLIAKAVHDIGCRLVPLMADRFDCGKNRYVFVRNRGAIIGVMVNGDSFLKKPGVRE